MTRGYICHIYILSFLPVLYQRGASLHPFTRTQVEQMERHLCKIMFYGGLVNKFLWWAIINQKEQLGLPQCQPQPSDPSTRVYFLHGSCKGVVTALYLTYYYMESTQSIPIQSVCLKIWYPNPSADQSPVSLRFDAHLGSIQHFQTRKNVSYQVHQLFPSKSVFVHIHIFQNI